MINKRAFKPKNIDEKTQTIGAVLATESRVDMGNCEEILLMSGCNIPEQVPLIDTHERWTIKGILGSCRQMKIDDGQLVGQCVFAGSETGKDSFMLARDGHLSDLSIGYTIDDYVVINPKQTQTIGGRQFTAGELPLRVVTRWTLKEVSCCPIGADTNAKFRSQNKGNNMLTLEQEKKRVDEIRAMGKVAEINSEIIERCVTENKTIEETKAIYLEEIRGARKAPVTSSSSPHVTGGVDLQRQGFAESMADAICLRGGVKIETTNPRAKAMQSKPLPFLVRGLLSLQNIDVDAMSDRQVIQKAFSMRAGSTLSLSDVLGDAMNKALAAAAAEYPQQWQKFCKKRSAPNFLDLRNYRSSEVEDLRLVPPSGEYSYAQIGEDAANVYRLAKYGNIIGVSFEQITNDDLSFISQIVPGQAAAAARMTDALAFAALVENAVQADSQTFYHSTHGNLATVSGAPTIATLSAMRLSFRMQKGKANDAFLNLTPKTIIVPAAMETATERLLGTEKVGVTGDTDAEIETIRNPFFKKYELVTHPLLDASSTTAWYAACDGPDAPVEVAFLNGQEMPYSERLEDFSTDVIKFKVRHIVAAKAVNVKGAYKNAG
jgi:hypothetical protein